MRTQQPVTQRPHLHSLSDLYDALQEEKKAQAPNPRVQQAFVLSLALPERNRKHGGQKIVWDEGEQAFLWITKRRAYNMGDDFVAVQKSIGNIGGLYHTKDDR